MSNLATVVDRIVIPHTAFLEAEKRIEQCFTYCVDKVEAEGLAIIGESGTGKSRALKSFRDKHRPIRTVDGMVVPILSASVPSNPTVKSLAGVLLEGLKAPDCDRGTESEKSRRLRELMKQTGTRMVMIDEFQHFFDRGTQKIMYHVADWLKLLIDDTRSTLIVAGLPSCMSVIDSNPQLARRFLAPFQLTRFKWQDLESRGQFIKILKAFDRAIGKDYTVPKLYSEDMAYRFYLATGGLMGYLSKILRQTLRNADLEKRTLITLDDLNRAHTEAIWSRERIAGLPKPFESDFQLVNVSAILDAVDRIGIAIESVPTSARCNARGPRRESASNALVT
jgi:Bacterial TniB protein